MREAEQLAGLPSSCSGSPHDSPRFSASPPSHSRGPDAGFPSPRKAPPFRVDRRVFLSCFSSFSSLLLRFSLASVPVSAGVLARGVQPACSFPLACSSALLQTRCASRGIGGI